MDFKDYILSQEKTKVLNQSQLILPSLEKTRLSSVNPNSTEIKSPLMPPSRTVRTPNGSYRLPDDDSKIAFSAGGSVDPDEHPFGAHGPLPADTKNHWEDPNHFLYGHRNK